MKRFTGTLVLRAGDEAGPLAGESRFAFVAGALAQARLAQPLDTLGFVLHEQGTITSAQLDASLARLAKGEGLQGEILIATGACTRAAVVHALREQLRRKLLRFFSVAYGQYEVHAERDLLAGFGRERFPVDVLPLLWPGVRSHPRHPAVDAVIARLGATPLCLREGSPARALVGDGAPERALLDRLAATARVDDLLALAPANALLPRALLFLLAMTRQIERAAPPSQPFIVAVPSDAVRPAPAPPGPTQRISVTNLPIVKGPSLADVARGAQDRGAAPRDGLVARVAEADKQLARMQDQSAFQMLMVAPDAPTAAVTAAFHGLATRWHPDAAPESSPALREVHGRIFALLAEAEATLTHDALRETHLRDVAQGNGTPRARATRPRREQERSRAEVALRQGAWSEAERAARAVLDDDAADATALTILAAALLERLPGGPYDEVRRCIVAACQKDPHNDRAHVVAGQMYKRVGDERRTLAHFIKAYKINPRNVDAVRELRIAAMRRRDASLDAESAGFLARLFGLK